jgi:hypothetical protein
VKIIITGTMVVVVMVLSLKLNLPRHPFLPLMRPRHIFDWEMIIEQNCNSHLVPEIHRVRQAISEFKDFSIILWQELGDMCLQPDTWNMLKEAMHSCFVPPSYQRDMYKKLQMLRIR